MPFAVNEYGGWRRHWRVPCLSASVFVGKGQGGKAWSGGSPQRWDAVVFVMTKGGAKIATAVNGTMARTCLSAGVARFATVVAERIVYDSTVSQ